MIPPEFIDALLDKTDIVDVVDSVVPLKKNGRNYVACCPFHKEKTPSFSVSPDKQFYHCFGCGAHGSALGFIMEYQGLGFVEAVEQLAGKAGLTVPREAGSVPAGQSRARKEKQQSLEETVQTAAGFYRESLGRSGKAQGYLKARGLSEAVANEYGLGYAPDDFHALRNAFSPYPDGNLIESGMVIEKEGRHYDRFRDRIMFPIKNLRGHVVGFGGRVLDKGTPKYLNSPETPLFDKGRNLYGLYEARRSVKEAGRIVVVEGYMDVVALAQFGIGYAVAALGTATTEDQIRLLMRQSDNIYFCYDGDSAGRKAARRALETALPLLQDDKNLRFLFLPEEHDPDSYVRAFGKDGFEALLTDNSRPLSACLWQYLTEGLDIGTQEGKARLIKESTPLLAKIRAPALAYLLRQELAEMVGVEDGVLSGLMGRKPVPSTTAKSRSYRRQPAVSGRPKMLTLVQKQIRSLLINPQWAVYTDVPEYLDLEGDYACLAALSERIRASVVPLSSGAVLEMMRGTGHEPLISFVLQASGRDGNTGYADNEDDCATFKDGMQKIWAMLKNRRIEVLKEQLQAGALSASEKELLLSLLNSKKRCPSP